MLRVLSWFVRNADTELLISHSTPDTQRSWQYEEPLTLRNSNMFNWDVLIIPINHSDLELGIFSTFCVFIKLNLHWPNCSVGNIGDQYCFNNSICAVINDCSWGLKE